MLYAPLEPFKTAAANPLSFERIVNGQQIDVRTLVDETIEDIFYGFADKFVASTT